jgi:hypothetical protein
MFRDETVCSEKFTKKFTELKKKFDEKVEINLDSEYHQQLKNYIDRVYAQTCSVELFDDKKFNDLRDAEMSNLNRLQKLKNGTSYKKDKHKSKHEQEDWG